MVLRNLETSVRILWSQWLWDKKDIYTYCIYKWGNYLSESHSILAIPRLPSSICIYQVLQLPKTVGPGSFQGFRKTMSRNIICKKVIRDGKYVLTHSNYLSLAGDFMFNSLTFPGVSEAFYCTERSSSNWAVGWSWALGGSWVVPPTHYSIQRTLPSGTVIWHEAADSLSLQETTWSPRSSSCLFSTCAVSCHSVNPHVSTALFSVFQNWRILKERISLFPCFTIRFLPGIRNKWLSFHISLIIISWLKFLSWGLACLQEGIDLRPLQKVIKLVLLFTIVLKQGCQENSYSQIHKLLVTL